MSSLQRGTGVVANGRHLSPQACGDSGGAYPCGFEIAGHVEDVAQSDRCAASVGNGSCHDAVALIASKHADRLVSEKRRLEEARPLGEPGPGCLPLTKLLRCGQDGPSPSGLDARLSGLPGDPVSAEERPKPRGGEV